MVAAAGPRPGPNAREAARAKVLRSESPFLSEWLADFLELREKSRYRNVASERVLVRTHVSPDPIAAMALRALTPVILQAFWRRLVERSTTTPHHMPKAPRVKGRPLSRSSVANVLTIVRCALERAVQAGHIEHNPARGLSVPRALGATTALEFEGVLEAPEEAALLAELARRASGGDRQWIAAGAMVRFALGTGCRRGEMLSLRWREVHMESGVPFVIVRDSGRGRIADGAAPPKGGRPRRVPLFGMALEAVRGLERGKSPWVFPGDRGGRRKLPPTRALREALAAVGVFRRVRWHDLRHTCATALLEGTRGSAWTVEAVQQLLGHASITTTERYIHARGSLAFAAARAADRVVQPAPAATPCDETRVPPSSCKVSGPSWGEESRFSGSSGQVPGPPARSGDTKTPLRPAALINPIDRRVRLGVLRRKQVAMLTSVQAPSNGTRERGERHTASRPVSRSSDADRAGESLAGPVYLGTASCSQPQEERVPTDTILKDLRAQLEESLLSQERVLLRYLDGEGVESTTTGRVFHLDGSHVAVTASKTADRGVTRVRLERVISVQPFPEPEMGVAPRGES